MKKIILAVCFMAGSYVFLTAQEASNTAAQEAAAAAPVTFAVSAALPVTVLVSEAIPVTPAAAVKPESVTNEAAPAATPVSITRSAINADYAAAVTRAVENSTAVKQALASLNEAKALLEKEQGVSDLTLNAGVFYSDSADKSLDLQQPESEKTLKYSAGLSGRLITGGDFSLNFTSSREDLLFPDYTGSVDASLLRPSIDPYYYPEFVISYTQPLLQGFIGDPAGKKIQAAAYRVKAAGEKLKETILGLAFEIKKAWYEVYTADISQKAGKNYAKDIGSAYVLMKAAGKGEADLLMAKAASVTSGVLVRKLEKNLVSCREKYLNLAGFTPDEWENAVITLDENLEDVYIPAEMTNDLEDTLMSLQPAVTAEKFNTLAAEAESSGVEFLNLPRLALTGSAGFTGVSGNPGDAFMALSEGRYRDMSVGLDLTWDIPGMAQAGEKDAKKEAVNKANAAYEAAQNAGRIIIRAAYKGISQEKENYEAMKEARLLYEHRVKLLIEAGASAELLRAELDRYNIRRDEADAFVSYAMSIAGWNLVNGKYDAFFNEYLRAKE